MRRQSRRKSEKTPKNSREFSTAYAQACSHRNGLMDLWAEIGIPDMGERLGKFIGRYREAYFKPGSMNPSQGIVYSYVPREGAEEMIYKRIEDITISMKAMDYLKMPESIKVNHSICGTRSKTV